MELPNTEIPALKEGELPLRIDVPQNERASVLVVDDNPAKLASLASIVSDMGLVVVTAKSGREALRQLLKRDFALILLDVYMPTLDGYETATLIHSRPRSAHVPVIFVTAEASTEAERFKGYTVGAVDWIFSPIVPEILQAKVKVFVDLNYLNRMARRQNEELHRRAEEIERKNLQLEEASRMKSEFLANMSHELRTPLNAIIGFSEVLKDGLAGELTAEQKGFVTDIYDSGNHLLSLINDILDLSKVEAGKMTLELEPVDVGVVLNSSLTMLKEKALKHRIQLKLEMPPEMGGIVADGRKLKQVLYNLLSNAVKFTRDGGEVRVAARTVRRAEVKIDPPEGTAARVLPLPPGDFDDFLEISVRDTGIGIEEADMRRLFQAFIQLDSSLARQYEGTGLGLALVRRLANQHGGTVGVASALGKGSCFVVWLPWRKATETAESAGASPPTMAVEAPVPAGISAAAQAGESKASASSPLVLVIEDNDNAAELLRLHLEGAGFRVVHAPNVVMGLELAKRDKPALITLDILLPGLSGWEALERLKADPGLSDIPVVIVSIAAHRQRGYALGAARVLQKPVSRQSLLDAIRESGVGVGGKKKTTVLVVDDDPKAVELMAARLKGTGCQVVRAYGGREAIKMVRQMLPDLIVLDLMMPDVSGFEVVEALKSRPETARVPILIVTAKQVTKEDRRRLNGFIMGILEKSRFDAKQFLNEVWRALGKTQ